MGNLIIKPNTGGTLNLQDEGGTDAISISTTGNTTLAGTANALGTVASGNLSNTAIVYPAGHVIQTVHQSIYQGSLAYSGATAFTATPNICTITPKSSSSKILIQVDQPYFVAGAVSSDNAVAYEIWKDTGGGGYASLANFNNGAAAIQAYGNPAGSAGWQMAGRMSYSYLDSPATTSLVSYRIYMGQWSSRTTGNNSNHWSSETTWVLQEIAQ
jgi:hypothetical protein